MVLDDAWNETTRLKGHAGVRPVHLVTALLALVNFALNGLIWYAFRVQSGTINKSHLHLFYAFAVSNCLTGFFSMPTFFNLFLHNNLNCPRWTIIIGSAFEMGLCRMRAILSIAIALERLYAICKPRTFFLMNHPKIARRIVAFAVFWSVTDAVLMIAEDNILTIRIHCVSTSSSGELFHTYFLISGIVDGCVLLIVYVVFLIRFLSIKKKLPESAASKHIVSKERKGMKETVNQVNTLTLAVLLCVLVFSVFPNCLYGYDLIIHQVYFMDLGPAVTMGYHLHGISSSFCYNYKHREIKKALDRVYPIRKRTCLATLSTSERAAQQDQVAGPTRQRTAQEADSSSEVVVVHHQVTVNESKWGNGSGSVTVTAAFVDDSGGTRDDTDVML